jgi:hypothetical protein
MVQFGVGHVKRANYFAACVYDLKMDVFSFMIAAPGASDIKNSIG